MIPFGLYIHWPFCLSKCPYCDFNSHVRETIDENAWLNALVCELKRWRSKTPQHHLKTIFFGGGTPSLMHPKTVAVLIQTALDLWPHDDDIEINLEANPNSVEIEKFDGLRSAGVNRISIGVQSLIPDDLKSLGRQHTVDEGLRAIDIAQKTFDRYSFDLIYARPHQTVQNWERELHHALEMAGDHLSLYQLTIEPGTLFEKHHKRGDLVIPAEEQAFEFYALTQNIMESFGFSAYEVSNHAKPGHACRHNLIYWQYGDYIGVGPGAHGRVTLGGQKYATRQHKAPETWVKSVVENGHGSAEHILLSPSESLEERIMMGLRISDGLNIKTIENGLNWDRVKILERENFLKCEDGQLKATTSGRLCLNSVTSYILV